MEHDLKILPEYFDAVDDGSKPFEARREDGARQFAVGDTLILREWDSGQMDLAEIMIYLRAHPHEGAEVEKLEARCYTGRVCRKRVTYVLRDTQWLQQGVACLGIRREEVDMNSLPALPAKEFVERLYRTTLPPGVPLPWQRITNARFTRRGRYRRATAGVVLWDDTRAELVVQGTPDYPAIQWLTLRRDFHWTGEQWDWVDQGSEVPANG